MLEGKSAFLQVDLSQSTTKEKEFKVLSLGGGSNTTMAASPTQVFPPKVESQISMSMEVSMVLDTSSQALGSSTPKRPVSLALASSLNIKLDNSTKPVDTSSQVSIPDKEEIDNPMLEDIHASPSNPDGTPKGSSDASCLEATQLWEEANKALGCLLATRSTIDTCRRKEISEFGMALCLNESEVAEAMKTVKALCAHTVRKVEALCAHTIREAEAHHTALVSKADIHHVACIKKPTMLAPW